MQYVNLGLTMPKKFKSQKQTRFEVDNDAIGNSELSPKIQYGSASYEHNEEMFPMTRKSIDIKCPKCSATKHRFVSKEPSEDKYNRCLICQHEWIDKPKNIQKQLVPKKVHETVHRGGKVFSRDRTIMTKPEDQVPLFRLEGATRTIARQDIKKLFPFRDAGDFSLEIMKEINRMIRHDEVITYLDYTFPKAGKGYALRDSKLSPESQKEKESLRSLKGGSWVNAPKEVQEAAKLNIKKVARGEIKKEFGSISGVSTPTFNKPDSKEIRDKIDKLINKSVGEISEEAHPHKVKSELQHKVLGKIKYFERKQLQGKISEIVKNLEYILNNEQKVDKFIKGYERLILVPQLVNTDGLNSIFQIAKEVNLIKEYHSPIIIKEITNSNIMAGINETALMLYDIRTSSGDRLYNRLSELEDLTRCLSKSQDHIKLQAEENRGRLEQITNMDIMYKGKLLEKSLSFWRLFEISIKHGVEKLDNKNLILLREWLYAKI